MEDSRIVDLYIQRNESAVTETSRKYGTFLRSIAQRITGDKPTAEECENDAYLEAWNTIPPHEPRSYLAAYLSRIVRNISLNRCVERRSLKRSATVCALTDELEMCLPSQENVAEQLEGKELAARISDYLRGQTPEKRRIFLQRYFYFDRVSAIAFRYGMTSGKVKTVLFRMRNELREYLRKEGFSL